MVFEIKHVIVIKYMKQRNLLKYCYNFNLKIIGNNYKMNKRYVLVFCAPDRMGIESKITTFLYKRGAFLSDIQSYSDTQKKLFFSRVVFSFPKITLISKMLSEFETLAAELNMKFKLNKIDDKIKVLIAVSNEGHCLNDLLYRAKFKEVPYEIVGVVSNHEKFRGIVEQSGLKYFYLPISGNKDSKIKQEDKFHKIAESLDADLIVLARYMQILTEDFVSKWENKCINIHHSFLPSFKGAEPYKQAFNKGVKIIGATAHYVTKDLDEGPIIEQDVERVFQRDTIEDISRKGNDIESRVLANALMWHAESKIIINGNKTIIFA